MNALTANLKHFYQRPGMWAVYLILFLYTLFEIAVLRTDKGFNLYVFPFGLLFSVIFATFTGSLVKDVQNKPFSFLLPGYRAIPRKVILGAGIVFNMIWSVITAAINPLSGESLFTVFFISFFLGMGGFFTSILVLFRFRQVQQHVWPFVVVLAFFSFSSQLRANFCVMVFAHSVYVCAVGLILLLFSWYWLGRPDHARRLAMTPFLTMFDSYNEAKTERFKLKNRLWSKEQSSGILDNWIDSFFFNRMTRSKPFSLRRNLWGQFYSYVSQVQKNVVMGLLGTVLFYVVLLGWMSKEATEHVSFTIFLWVSVAIAFSLLRIHLVRSILLPLGRSQWFLTIFCTIVVTSLLVSAGLLALGGLLALLRYFHPHIELGGTTYSMPAFNLFYTSFPLLYFPLAFAVACISRNNIFLSIVVLLIFGVVPFLAFGWIEGYLFFVPFIWAIFALALGHFFRTARLA